MIWQTFGLLFVGGISGAFGALLGLGGGIFMIPALVLIFKVPMHSAVGVGLVAVIATSSAGGWRNAAQGLANVRLGMTLEVFTVSGALIGGFAAPFVRANVLEGIFGFMLILVGLVLWKRHPGTSVESSAALEGPGDVQYIDAASGKTVSYSVEKIPAALGVSLVAGLLSALLGVGGGILNVPAMHIWSRVPMKAATATSNLMIGVTAAASAVLYIGRGDVPYMTAGAVAVGVLGGSWFGLRMARRLSDRRMAQIFALVALTMAGLMLRRSCGH